MRNKRSEKYIYSLYLILYFCISGIFQIQKTQILELKRVFFVWEKRDNSVGMVFLLVWGAPV